MSPMSLLSRRVMLSLLSAVTIGHAAAQSYPSKTVRIIVASPAGGPTDVLTRVIGQRMSEEWAQPVLVENRSGADGVVGAQLAAKAPPDGYTLFTAMDTALVMNPLLIPNLPYDPLRDFALITLAATNTSLIVVRAEDGPKTMQELIERAKANPGKMNYGAGIVTTRLAGYLFNRTAGIDVQFVPYKGSADVLQGLLNGSVDFTVDGSAPYLSLIRSGKLRPLAKLNSLPLAVLPELKPLAVAANLPGLGDISTWGSLVAPAGTPTAVIDKVHRSVVKMYTDPEIVGRLLKAGITATSSSSPAEFEAFVRKESNRWSKFVKESGVKFD